MIGDDVQVVISRYNEDIRWSNIFTNTVIYNKGDALMQNNVINLDNVGRECHTYYTHIYNNYDNLYDHIIFLQGHPFGHSPNIISTIILKYLNTCNDIDFEFLSEKVLDCNLSGCSYHPGIPLIDTFENIFGKRKTNLKFKFGVGGQFIVSKKCILKNSKSFYMNIIKLLEYAIDPIEGYVIERLHSVIFNSAYITYGDECRKVNIVDKYLNTHFNDTSHLISRKIRNNNKLAMIIEPRCHYRLYNTIINVLYFLGSDYDLLFIGSNTSIQYFKHLFPTMECHIEPINSENLDWKGYSKIMMDKELLLKYKYEDIIIFQTDSILLRPLPDYVYDYAIVGAIDYMMASHDTYLKIYNGGFSFRKRSFMLKCLNTITINDINTYRKRVNMLISDVLADDFYYSQCLSILNHDTISDIDININIFGQNECFFSNDVLSIHSYDKDSSRFISYENISILLEKSISYMNTRHGA